MHLIIFDRNAICLAKNDVTVRKGRKASQPKQLIAGARQGGVLSAIFYLLCMNDFANANSSTKIQQIMFTDDTIIFAVTKEMNKAQRASKDTHLSKVSNYVKCWKLKQNEQKTEVISIVGYHRDLTEPLGKKQSKGLPTTMVLLAFFDIFTYIVRYCALHC